MRVQAAQRLCRVGHFAQHIAARNDAGIAHLAATLAVERCLVGNNGYGVALDSGLHFDTVIDERDNLPLALACSVARKLGRPDAFGDIEPNVIGCFGA